MKVNDPPMVTEVTAGRIETAESKIRRMGLQSPYRPAKETGVEKSDSSQPRVLTSAKKKRIRRNEADSSQALRLSFQLAFVLMNLWIGTEFYLFVRHYETGGIGPALERPAGVEGWLPIAGLMNLKYFLLTSLMPRIHAPAMFLLLAFLLVSLLWSKSFCGWLCPVGTISEAIWKAGRKLFRRNLRVPKWLDLPLRSLKYILLAFFLYAVGSMPPAAISAFMQGPYGLVADVKMLNFFRHLSQTAALVILGLVALSIPIQNFWCRYLCPYGALMGLAALLSPGKVRREPEACIDCAKCAKACPALLPVDKKLVVRSMECTSCMECVAVCPTQGALYVGFGRRRAVSPWLIATGIATIFLSVVIYAQWSGHWRSPVPDELNRRLIPHAHELAHP